MNPAGLLTPGKLHACQTLADNQRLDVLALTETHLTENNEDIAHDKTGKWRLIFIPAPKRQQNQIGRGGLGLLIKEHITATMINNLIDVAFIT